MTRALGGIEATLALARVTLLRLRRGRAIWVAAGLTALPLLYATTREDRSLEDWGAVVAFWGYLLAILPPVLLAASIGEELEDRTATYLWSRPLPRWTIVVGKVVAVVPILWALLAIALVAPLAAFYGDLPGHGALIARALGAVGLGTVAACAVTAGLSTLMPRHATVTSLAYLVAVDRSLAWTDASITRLSVTSDALRLSGVYTPAPAITSMVGWLVGLAAVWVAIAVWRMRRLE